MTATLTLRELAPMMREAMRDKSYEECNLGFARAVVGR